MNSFDIFYNKIISEHAAKYAFALRMSGHVGHVSCTVGPLLNSTVQTATHWRRHASEDIEQIVKHLLDDMLDKGAGDPAFTEVMDAWKKKAEEEPVLWEKSKVYPEYALKELAKCARDLARDPSKMCQQPPAPYEFEGGEIEFKMMLVNIETFGGFYEQV